MSERLTAQELAMLASPAHIGSHQPWIGELDLVNVVRCRDCKDYRASDATCHSWQWHNWAAAIEVEPNGFCAWGERS